MNLIEEIPHRMAENAAFFWLLHDQALNSPDYDVTELAELEARIDAQLDGLIAYGEDGWKACEEALQFEEPGEVFTAAVIALTRGSGPQLKQVFELGFQSKENYQALLSALVWLPFDTVKGWLGKFMHADNPAFAGLGISACALHRANCGDALNKALQNPSMAATPEYLCQVIRAAALMRRADVSENLAAYQNDENPSLVLASIYYACLLGDKSNMSLLKPLLLADLDFAEQSIDLVFRSLPLNEAKVWMSDMFKQPELKPVLFQALGILGDTTYLPWLVEQMENESVAKFAAASFSRIFGINIEEQGLAVPTSVPHDDAVDDDYDSDLPVPDPKKVQQWYASNANRLSSGGRYLAGRAVTQDNCLIQMQHGQQRDRRDAYMELLINYPNAVIDENKRRLRV